MQLGFFLLTLLLVAVALFALQNPERVTIRFWPWEVQASLAVVTLAAVAVGAFLGGLFGLTMRFLRWSQARATARLTHDGTATAGSPAAGDPADPKTP